ncbi:MAG: hypothetical protein ACM3VS_06600 [Candidatus Dadabacteria bacterium]
MKKILLALFLLIAGMVTTESVKAQITPQVNEPMIVKVAPPAVMNYIRDYTEHFARIGVSVSGQLYQSHGKYIWVVTLDADGMYLNTYVILLTPRGEVISSDF